MPTLCICGIDTGIGKSFVTGLMARHLLDQEKKVITQKLIQTGSTTYRPEDILIHRKLMEVGWLDEDEQKLTCPYSFSFPGSPHLAARLEGRSIIPQVMYDATNRLEARYDWVLVEAAGGLHVPITENLTLIDYLARHKYSIVLVTSPRLGSINHTLLSLEALKARNIDLAGLVYNLYDGGPDEIIQDSLRVFTKALQTHGFEDNVAVLPKWPEEKNIDWSKIIASL